MNRLLSNYKYFVSEGEKYHKTNMFSYMRYLFYRLYYGIGILDYYENQLWDASADHSDYFRHLHTYIHKWKQVKNNYKPEQGMLWNAIHYLDYLTCKVYCPGIDAMDYFRYEFYNIKPVKRKTFITEGGISKMNSILNGDKNAIETAQVFANKVAFNNLFSDFIQRKWIFSKDISFSQLDKFCEGLEKVIIKQVSGGGGKGIFISNVVSTEERKELFKELISKEYIVEELIEQEPVISSLNPTSVNTLRVYTVYHENEIYVTGATLRIGNGPGCTDNYSSGGLAAEIDVDTGMVISRAVSQNGESVYIHPVTGKPILGVIVPKWDEVKRVVKQAHSLVPELGYIGWDVVVCKDGNITFLEANTCAGVELQQHPGLTGKKSIYEPFVKKKKRGSL